MPVPLAPTLALAPTSAPMVLNKAWTVRLSAVRCEMSTRLSCRASTVDLTTFTATFTTLALRVCPSMRASLSAFPSVFTRAVPATSSVPRPVSLDFAEIGTDASARLVSTDTMDPEKPLFGCLASAVALAV